MPPRPPELMAELVEEVLLRFPPDDPASLVRAALVCKLWCRLVCGAAFRRRFREFHFHRNRAPLLGVVYTGGDCKLRHDNDTCGDTADPSVNKPVSRAAYFVPTTSIHRAHAADCRPGWHAMDARHGRVLLYRSSDRMHRQSFSVWNPITDEQRDLPELPLNLPCRYCAAVACAATAGGNCNHLDCHQGPFLVVVMDMQPHAMYFFIYSSEAGAWSQVADFERPTVNYLGLFGRTPNVLVGSALYFLVHINDEIVRYNLATQEVSKMSLPSEFHDHLLKQRSIVLMTDDDGGLGLAVASMEYELELWSMVAGGDAGFVLRRVIDLVRLLPCVALIDKSPQVNGYVDAGASRFLFLRTPDGLYTIEINSSQFKKVAKCCDDDKVVLPYVSFCTPTSRVQVQDYSNPGCGF